MISYISIAGSHYKCFIYIYIVADIEFVRPKGEEHGTPPNNNAPGLRRKVYFNAIKNPVGVDRSCKGPSTISNFFLGALVMKSKKELK